MSRLLTKLNPADRIVLVFTVIQTAYALSTGNGAGRMALITGGNLIIFITVLLIVTLREHYKGQALFLLHRFYPIVLNIWFYPRSCELRHGLFSGSFDPQLIHFERLIFGYEWYRLLPGIMSAGFLELFHAIYFLYYIALVIFPWLVLKKQGHRVAVYVYTLTVTMALHHAFIMLFPASGPVYLRSELLPDGLVFIPIMNWIYQNLDFGGGAFPSLHVAAAMVLYYFSLYFFPRARLAIAVFTLSVLVSTVAGIFHYSIDVLAGIITGSLCCFFIPNTYRWFQMDSDYA